MNDFANITPAQAKAYIARWDEWLEERKAMADRQAITYLELVSAMSQHLGTTSRLARIAGL